MDMLPFPLPVVDTLPPAELPNVRFLLCLLSFPNSLGGFVVEGLVTAVIIIAIALPPFALSAS